MSEITTKLREALENHAVFQDADVEAAIHNSLKLLGTDLDTAIYEASPDAEKGFESLSILLGNLAEDDAAEEIESVDKELDIVPQELSEDEEEAEEEEQDSVDATTEDLTEDSELDDDLEPEPDEK